MLTIKGFRPVEKKYPISCKYGTKCDTSGPPEKWTWKRGYHSGIDFATPKGSPVRAFNDGDIEIAGNFGDGLGIRVIINHGDYRSMYCHLADHFVDPHEKIKKGGYFAATGNSGERHDGVPMPAHLHFETRDMRGNPFEPTFEEDA